MVHKTSESLCSLSSLDQIGKNVMHTALEGMCIDSGRIFLLNQEKRIYECLTEVKGDRDGAESEPGRSSAMAPEILPADDPLLQKIAERKREVTVYPIQEDPYRGYGKYCL